MNPSSSNQQQAPHHRRRISEPPDLSGRRRRIMLSKTQSRSTRDLVTAVASTTAIATTIGQEQHPPTARSSRSSSIVDVSLFQDSWTNASFSDHHHNNTASNSNNNSMSSSWGGGADDGTTNPSLTNHNNNNSSTTTTTTPGTATAAAPVLSPSAIHDAARITDWDTVLELCHSHPHLASYRGSVGYTALHHACNRRCPRIDVVRALLQASCQSLYQQEDEKGWLPLHFACRFKMPRAAVQLLLEYEEAAGKWTVSKRDRLGRTPLFYAIRYDAPAGVVELLLQHDPAVILAVDDNDDSPLKLVWDAWADKLQGKRVVHSFLPGGFECKDDTAAAALSVHERARLLRERLPAEHKLHQKWEKANLLLQAAFGFPVAENAVSENDDDEDNNQDNRDGDGLKTQALLEMTSATSDDNDDNNNKKRKWRIVHATAAVKCHLSLFLLACALYPEQAAELDENDLRRDARSSTTSRPPHQTALHLAASSNADGEAGKAVILTLLSLHREAAEVQDGIDGSLPLHRMVENERKRDWPQHAAILYHFYPRAVQVADFNGRLPLHRAAAAMTPQAASSSSSSAQHHDANAPARGEQQQEQDEDMSEERSVIIQLVRAFPQAASRADSVGYFPLHLAAQNAASWDENLQAIYNAHRAAVLARAGPDGRLALHMAAANPKAEASLIERLLELHPRAASMPDRHGNLPLHLACELGRDWQIVRLLYEAFPAAIQQARGEGWLPLHMACAADAADNDLIAQLVAVYPAAASIPDRHGRYPLHLACDSGKSWKTGGLEALVLADAEVTSTPDAAGRVPFHVAAFKFASPDHGDPESAVPTFLPPWLKNQKNDCEKETRELDILFELLRADPTVL